MHAYERTTLVDVILLSLKSRDTLDKGHFKSWSDFMLQICILWNFHQFF